MNPNRVTIATMTLCGALAGLAGAIEILGSIGYVGASHTSSAGFDGITAALLGRAAPFGILGGGVYVFFESWKRSPKMQKVMDRMLLRAPIFGDLVMKSSVARWTRTLSTMFAAGVPLVEALDSVGGASGNAVYAEATEQIQKDVSTGSALTTSMQTTGVFPVMVIQMCAIGEESGSLDQMLGKAAEFFEDEVDEAVKGLSSLLEPVIIVILGTLIGGIVVAMYLPIFKLGAVV